MEQQCIFCAIKDKQMQSFEVGENSDAIAVLEINPISKAHTIVIPKQHIDSQEKLTEKTLELSQEVVDKIKSQLKPKSVTVFASVMFGHFVINILPVYKSEKPDSPRQQANPTELQKIQKKLKQEKKVEQIKIPDKKKKDAEASDVNNKNKMPSEGRAGDSASQSGKESKVETLPDGTKIKIINQPEPKVLQWEQLPDRD